MLLFCKCYTGSSTTLAEPCNTILRNSAREYGLEISEEKSKVLQVRGREKPETVGNFEVVKEVKYLGLKVGGYGRDIFKYEREDTIKKHKQKRHK